MSRGHDIVRRLASRLRPSNSICKSCLSTLRHERLASTAASAAEIPSESLPPDDSSPSLSASSPPQSSYQVKASVLLSRPPVLTRDLTPFEKAYFLYQRRLNERLALPFTRYFYYQRGTPEDVEWKRKMKERHTPARDIGLYNPYSDEGWNDELLLGAKESEPEEQIEALVRDAQVEQKESGEDGEVGEAEVVRGKKQEVIEKPMERITEADRIGDFKSLNRALTRTLYLVVQEAGNGKKPGRWNFPSSALIGKESLHTAAERLLVQSAGPNMNTWVVGNVPIGHQIFNYPQRIVNKEKGFERVGEKIFYMKARIMAGQANLKDNKFGLKDFKWLAKDEIQKIFHLRDWMVVRNILAER